MKRLLLCLVIASWLTGCAHTALKAPCNSTGSNCSQKIKINQWNNK